ncbi:hypothetical protein LCGC14_2818690 [marine sediment metagenome]|uniref:Uncharacterized protein n=1 Tax=marine sediment metagenome TaxID=412755 RepID=A0A0F8YHR9_9ZZZZ|nr:hypothetical protein [Candidatus Scalindua sp.]
MKVDFYCKNCELDQTLSAARCRNGSVKWFRARCGCGKKLIRRITDKSNDPYYYESRNVKMDREKHRRDLIQPGQEGFRTYYPEAQRKLEEAEEKLYKEEARKERERDTLYKKHKHDDKELVKKVIKKEMEIEYGGN